jgi:hypothetical protein
MKSMRDDRDPDFDGWLGHELRRRLASERGPRPHPAAARYRIAARRGGALMAIRTSIMAALGAKTMVGGAVVALAAGAVAGTAATGSANPATWGQRVVQTVQGCKHTVESGKTTGTVGECVSDFAQEHGEQVREQHSEAAEPASPSPKPGQREGQESSPSPDTDASHGHGKPSPKPSPSAATSHGNGNGGNGKSN